MRNGRPVKYTGGNKAMGRFFYLGLMTGSEPDDLAEELFVDLAEDFDADD
jgi:hypothetical protein